MRGPLDAVITHDQRWAAAQHHNPVEFTLSVPSQGLTNWQLSMGMVKG
jgi:hypothetical protein